jgi:hypothetical protein
MCFLFEGNLSDWPVCERMGWFDSGDGWRTRRQTVQGADSFWSSSGSLMMLMPVRLGARWNLWSSSLMAWIVKQQDSLKTK